MEDNDKPKMTRSERLRLQAFKNVQERKNKERTPLMTENERARLQAFKNVQERKSPKSYYQMKDNVFKIVVVGLLTAILIITLSQKQTGRYVGFGNDDFLLDTSTGEIYSIQGSVHYNMIDDIKEKQKQREMKRDSIERANKD